MAANPAAGVGLMAKIRADLAANPQRAAAAATASGRRTDPVNKNYGRMVADVIRPALLKVAPGVSLELLNEMMQERDPESQKTTGDLLQTVFQVIFEQSKSGSAESADLARSALASLYNADGIFAGSAWKLNEHQALKEHIQGAHVTQTKTGGGAKAPDVLDHEQFTHGLLTGAVAEARKVRSDAERARTRACARAVAGTDTSCPHPPTQAVGKKQYGAAGAVLVGLAMAVLTMYFCCRSISIKRLQWMNIKLCVSDAASRARALASAPACLY